MAPKLTNKEYYDGAHSKGWKLRPRVKHLIKNMREQGNIDYYKNFRSLREGTLERTFTPAKLTHEMAHFFAALVTLLNKRCFLLL